MRRIGAFPVCDNPGAECPRSLGQRAGGEGELDRRTVAAGQNVFGTRETEPQNLAALDKNVRAPEKSKMRTHATY